MALQTRAVAAISAALATELKDLCIFCVERSGTGGRSSQ